MTPYYKGERLNLARNQFAPKAHCATSTDQQFAAPGGAGFSLPGLLTRAVSLGQLEFRRPNSNSAGRNTGGGNDSQDLDAKHDNSAGKSTVCYPAIT